jgi:hypothetical protein
MDRRWRGSSASTPRPRTEARANCSSHLREQ